MSQPQWQTLLARTLSGLPRNERERRIAIVGMGHELRGDDAVGVWVALELQRQLKGRGDTKGLTVIAAGPVPENFTGVLRRREPGFVLLVDAGQLDEPPGSVRYLSWAETTGLSASTHSMPPYLFAKYLVSELGCQVAMLGVQPAQNAIGAALSPVVQRSAGELTRQLLAILTPHGTTSVGV